MSRNIFHNKRQQQASSCRSGGINGLRMSGGGGWCG